MQDNKEKQTIGMEEKIVMPMNNSSPNDDLQVPKPRYGDMSPNMQMTPIIGPNYAIPPMPYGMQNYMQNMMYDYNTQGIDMIPSTCNRMTNGLDDKDDPPVLGDVNYLQGYLKTLKGKYIRVDFLIGSNTFLDKEGVLVNVGVDHVILREPQTDDLIIADMYSIKFVKVFE